MSRRTQKYSVTGATNALTLDGGIQSTEDEKIKLIGVYISASALVGNTIEGWISQTRHVEIIDYVLRTHTASGTNQYPDTNGMHYIPVERDLEVGLAFKIGVNAGGTGSNIFGAYEFEVLNE